MLSFVAAVILLIITPGPGVLSLAGVGSSFGARIGLRYMVGLFIGTNAVCVGVITGLAAVLLTSPGLRAVFTFISVTYLVWLALRIALAGREIGFIHRPKPPGIRGGLLLQAFNPKAYVVNAALFSGFTFWDDAPGIEIAVKLVILNTIWIAIHLLYLWSGVQLRAMTLSDLTQRCINIAMALALLVVVCLAVLSI